MGSFEGVPVIAKDNLPLGLWLELSMAIILWAEEIVVMELVFYIKSSLSVLLLL